MAKLTIEVSSKTQVILDECPLNYVSCHGSDPQGPDGSILKWSNKQAPPLKVGSRVYTHFAGECEVVGYGIEYGWLYLRAKVLKPSKMYRERGDKPKDGIVWIAGIDLETRDA